MKPVQLKYCLFTAALQCNENRHAQTVMQELGITYQHATPQSIADCWQFWNCERLPDVMPPFLAPFEADPMRMVGRGLSHEEAEAIRDYSLPAQREPKGAR